MISLSYQIKAIIFSFFYGILFSFFFNLNYRFLFHYKKIIKIIFDFIFIIDSGLLYFYILQLLDYGYIHIYFLFSFIIGVYLFFSFFKKHIRNIRKKHVNK